MRNQSERVNCRGCDRPRDEVGSLRADGVRRLSARGLCRKCGLERVQENLERNPTSDPVWLERYRQGVARSVGAVLPAPSSRSS